jgi:ketosteroid isomerase-like protein
MSAEESKALMRRYFEGAWEKGDVDLLDELLAPNYVNHTPATPDLPTDPEGVKAVVSFFRNAMPDLRVVIEDMIAEGWSGCRTAGFGSTGASPTAWR